MLAFGAAALPAAAATPPRIPPHYLAWYKAAARTCRKLSWEVLAGIGTMESDNGRSTARGVHKGKNRSGAEGPMQFEPATFAEYAVRADPSAKLTPYNPKDAIFTAARMLCADGAATGHLQRAVFAYNHACWYVRDVLAIAARYRAQGRHRRAFGPHRRHRVRRAGLCTGHRHPHRYGRKHGSRTAHRSHPGRLAEEDVTVTVAGLDDHPVHGKKGHGPVPVDTTVEQVAEGDFDALVIPGGFAPDKLRRSQAVLDLVRAFDGAGKPIAFICHAGWVPISARILKGRRATSMRAIRDDMVNAGTDWVDEAPVVDANLISARTPADTGPGGTGPSGPACARVTGIRPGMVTNMALAQRKVLRSARDFAREEWPPSGAVRLMS